MANWVKIEELFNDKERFPEPEKLYISYKPDYNEYTFESEKTGIEKTGIEEEQCFYTEGLLGGWHPSKIFNGRIILVCHSATSTKLTLRGKAGWNHSRKLLEKCTKACYSNAKLKATGASMTKEVFKHLSDELKNSEQRCYWLPNKSQKNFDICVYFSVVVVYNGYFDLIPLYSSSGQKYENSCVVRPIIELPSNILVDIDDSNFDGTTEFKALKIKLGEDISSKTEEGNTNQKNKVKEAKALISQIEIQTQRANNEIAQITEETQRLKEILKELS